MFGWFCQPPWDALRGWKALYNSKERETKMDGWRGLDGGLLDGLSDEERET